MAIVIDKSTANFFFITFSWLLNVFFPPLYPPQHYIGTSIAVYETDPTTALLLKCGHLWQSRYKNYVIQKDLYLINCATYIEMNPVRAKMCQHPEDYPWCSYRGRIIGKPDEILDGYVF